MAPNASAGLADAAEHPAGKAALTVSSPRQPSASAAQTAAQAEGLETGLLLLFATTPSQKPSTLWP